MIVRARRRPVQGRVVHSWESTSSTTDSTLRPVESSTRRARRGDQRRCHTVEVSCRACGSTQRSLQDRSGEVLLRRRRQGRPAPSRRWRNIFSVRAGNTDSHRCRGPSTIPTVAATPGPLAANELLAHCGWAATIDTAAVTGGCGSPRSHPCVQHDAIYRTLSSTERAIAAARLGVCTSTPSASASSDHSAVHRTGVEALEASRRATSLATVDLPAPAGPSIAITGRRPPDRLSRTVLAERVADPLCGVLRPPSG